MEEDLVRRYFKGELSNSELKSFELQLENDKNFSRLVDEYRSMNNGIRLAKRDSLKQRLQAIESEKKSKNNFRRFAIAASIAILLGVGGMILWNQSQTTPQTLFAEYYEPYPNLYAPITRDGGNLSPLQESFVQYELGEYEKALSGFNKEIAQSNDPNILFYKGMTHIQLENYKDALDAFDVIDLENTDYHPQVLWYQAMLFLKMDQQENAKDQLKELDALNSGFKTKKVKDLLKKLG